MYSYQQIQDATATAPPAAASYTRDEFTTAATRPETAAMLAELRADAARDEPLPNLPYRLFRTYVHTGDRMEYEGRYFERRRRLNSAAAVALIDGGTDNLVALQDILWEICDEYSWAVPAHHRFNTTLDLGYDRCIDLFAAETAHTMSEVLALLGDDLEKPVRDRVRAEIDRRVLSPFLDEPRSRWWETSTNNWAAVCAGSIGMAGLALEDDPLRLAALIDRVQRTMAAFQSGFGPDGGCVEGMDYWVYGYGYFVYYAEALRARTGLDLLADTTHIAGFPAAIDFGGGYCVSFSDGSNRVVPPTGLMTRLADRVSAPLPHITRMSTFEDDRCFRWAHLSRTLLWGETSVIGRPSPVGTEWLSDLSWLIGREPDGTAFAAKGGHNAEPHNHLDLGSFILAVEGEQLLADLGSGVYDAAYFGPDRYLALHTSAAGHSVPIVAGVDQRPGEDSAAVVIDQVTGDGHVGLELDLSNAYDGRGFRRRFDWRDGHRLDLTDRFDDSGLPLVERFISRTDPELRPGQVVWRGKSGHVTLEYSGEWEVEVERIDTLDHHTNPETVFRLTLTGTTASEHRFEFTVGR